MNAYSIIELQGWNDETVLGLVWQFLEATGQVEKFTEFLNQKATEENEEV